MHIASDVICDTPNVSESCFIASCNDRPLFSQFLAYRVVVRTDHAKTSAHLLAAIAITSCMTTLRRGKYSSDSQRFDEWRVATNTNQPGVHSLIA